MTFRISVPINKFRSKHFVFANPNERLVLSNLDNARNTFTLHFVKTNVSIRIDTILSDSSSIMRLFALVLIHETSAYLRTHTDSCTGKQFVQRLSLQQVQQEVDRVVDNSNTRFLYQTIKYHFKQNSGVLLDVTEGYKILPPPDKQLYAPPRLLDQYGDMILFYNISHTIPVNFRTYNFNDNITVLNPFPVYKRGINFVIRNYQSGLCNIHPMFIYQKGKMAKLSSATTNKIAQYMFLLNIEDRLYEVMAIYPSDYIHKLRPKVLPKTKDFSLDRNHIAGLLNSINGETQNENMFLNITPYENHSLQLEDWLLQVVEKYVTKLVIIHDVPSTQLTKGDIGSLTVWVHESGLQFSIQLKSFCFVYSQCNKVSDAQETYWYFDDIVKDTTTQMIHLTAILRSVLQAMNCKSKQQTFCWDSVDIYKQSLLYELAETQHLIDYAGAKSILMII